MTIRICDRCKKQISYTSGYTLRVCIDMNTVFEKDICDNCKTFIIDAIDAFFEKEEQDVGD